MKTTIDIAEHTLREAKALAARRKTTLRELVEGQLRKAIEESREAPSFRLGRLPVRGGGLLPPYDTADWSSVREEIYRGRGA